MSKEKLNDWWWKWGTVRYNRRWFVLSTDAISYFRNEGDENPSGSMKISDVIITEDDSDEKKIMLSDGIVKYCLVSDSTGEMKNLWVNNLLKSGARKVSLEEFHEIEYCGELVPKLGFHLFNEEEIKENQHEDMSLLKHIETVGTSIVKSGVSATLNILTPAGSGPLVAVAVKGALTGGVKIFNFFSCPEKKLEKHLEDKINQHLFKSKLNMMEAEMIATRKRYENMLRYNFTIDERKIEIPVAMHRFQTVLSIFGIEQNLFLDNSFLTAPYLVRFSVLFLSFAELASLIHPGYIEELIKTVRELESCLILYKERVVKDRLAAICHDGESTGRYLKRVILRGAADKVTDNLYSTCEGLQPRWAYSYVKDGEQVQDFYVDYTNAVRELYENYFDNIIQKIRESKLIARRNASNNACFSI